MLLNLKGRAEGLGVKAGQVTIETNAYHVHIYRDGKEVWSRTPQNGNWQDPDHRAITNALEVLQNILQW